MRKYIYITQDWRWMVLADDATLLVSYLHSAREAIKMRDKGNLLECLKDMKAVIEDICGALDAVE